MKRFARFAAAILLLSVAVQARVISYSPYTDRSAVPAVQSRLNRHFVLVETMSPTSTFPPSPGGAPPIFSSTAAQVVLYDSKGLEEPRVVFPQDGTSVSIVGAAAREEG